jgi:hypothetical protein
MIFTEAMTPAGAMCAAHREAMEKLQQGYTR